jgi:hypothetical protein
MTPKRDNVDGKITDFTKLTVATLMVFASDEVILDDLGIEEAVPSTKRSNSQNVSRR